jgi:hypothetical protein
MGQYDGKTEDGHGKGGDSGGEKEGIRCEN